MYTSVMQRGMEGGREGSSCIKSCIIADGETYTNRQADRDPIVVLLMMTMKWFLHRPVPDDGTGRILMGPFHRLFSRSHPLNLITSMRRGERESVKFIIGVALTVPSVRRLRRAVF